MKNRKLEVPVQVVNHRNSDWYRIKSNKNSIPFNFQSYHPKIFKPIDFGIWAAFEPHKALNHFSSDLVEAYQYSWRFLANRVSEIPDFKCVSFAENIKYFPWLAKEFANWGAIFSALWITPENMEPGIYKLFSKSEFTRGLAKFYKCEDQVTPRLYTFDELTLVERSIFISDEDDDIEISNFQPILPNIGPHTIYDDGVTLVLPIGWGFNSDGQLSYVSQHHSELQKQRDRRKFSL